MKEKLKNILLKLYRSRLTIPAALIAFPCLYFLVLLFISSPIFAIGVVMFFAIMIGFIWIVAILYES